MIIPVDARIMVYSLLDKSIPLLKDICTVSIATEMKEVL